MSLFLQEADVKPKLGVQILLESNIGEEIRESSIGLEEMPGRMQIWQSLSQSTGEPQRLPIRQVPYWQEMSRCWNYILA